MDTFSSKTMIPAIEESLREFWRAWGQSPQAECYVGPETTRLYTGVPYSFCNGVNCSQLPPGCLEDILDETISFYRAKHVQWEWVVGPVANSPELEIALKNRGLSMGGKSIGMAIDLQDIPPVLPRIDGFQISQAMDEETLKTWAETVVAGFSAPALSPSFVNLEQSLGVHELSYRRYLGILDGKPVATSALLLGKNVAGIYCVSTIPSTRKLGIGAALTRYALEVARDTGYSCVVLQATEMGVGVYRRLGFQEFSILKNYGDPE